MKNYLILMLLHFVYHLPSFACGNEYEFYHFTHSYTNADGSIKETYGEYSGYYFNHGFNKEELNGKKVALEKALKEERKYQHLSDYALVLLKLGESKRSLTILQNLIKGHPNEYNINANLGTAYELNGKPDSALKYIRRGVKLNPNSHEGSEWIHVKILEAKLKMEKYPDYLKDHSILDLSLDINKDHTEEHIHIRDELAWQLKERIAFVKDPDPVVANLLFDMANLVAITEVLENAVPLYDLSIKYQPQNLKEVLARRDEVKEIIFWATVRNNALWVISTMLLVVGIFFLIRRILSVRKIRKERKAKSQTAEIPVYNSIHLQK